MTIRLFGSTSLTVTGMEISYISRCHWTVLPASSLPLLLVNQNLVGMSGLMKASNTSAAGLRISIAVFIIGAWVSWVFINASFLDWDDLSIRLIILSNVL